MPVVFSCALFAITLALGAAPERIIAGILLAVAASGWACGNLGLQQAEPVFALACLYIDVVALFAIVAVAMCANRLYPICVGGVQLVKIICHFWHLNLGHSCVPVHMLIDSLVFVLQLIMAAGGLILHIKRLGNLGGEYSSWSYRGKHAA